MASMKRFDGFSPRDIERFYAVAFAEETKSMANLINLSFNLHCYSLINNFSDFNKLDKYLYLHKDFIVDPFYLAQYRSSKSIFSHEIKR